MATDTSSFDSTLPSKPKQEEEIKNNDLIPSNPLYKDMAVRECRGFWIPEIFYPGVTAMQDNFKARPTDLLLATSLKSGTTWFRALMFATMTRKDYPLAHHPLLNKNPHDCFPNLEGSIAMGRLSEIDALPSPRLLATHVSYSLLPESVAASRIIYVCRDPKDVVVSAWHFLTKTITGESSEAYPFSKAFEMFCNGEFIYGPIWDHNLEYWRESLRRPERVLFLKYEEMIEEPSENLRRLAAFMGYPFSEEEEVMGVVEEIVSLCSFGKLTSLEVNKSGSLSGLKLDSSNFFRKGKVGDWVNCMSTEMARKLDAITQQKFGGSGLTLAGVESKDPTGHLTLPC